VIPVMTIIARVNGAFVNIGFIKKSVVADI
jgi:hypothetical protein